MAEEPRSSRVFTAQFAGQCALGCDGIKEGDQLVYASPDAERPQHVPGQCNIDPYKSLEHKYAVCPRCFLEVSASGRCDNCD